MLNATDKGTVADSYELQLEGIGNYSGTLSYIWKINPCELKGVSALQKTYDGTTALPDALTFSYGDNQTITLRGASGEDGTPADYTVVSGGFESADAGTSKTATFTIRLNSKNYAFTGGQKQTELKLTDAAIEKAGAPGSIASGALTIRNDQAATYVFDLSDLLPALAAGKSYGDVSYTLRSVDIDPDSDYVGKVDGKVTGSTLTLTVDRVDTSGSKPAGTVRVDVSSGNYEDFTLTVAVTAQDKITPTGTPVLSASTITYGQTVGSITLSGSMKDGENTVEGTLSWDAPDAILNAGTQHPAWTFTPKDTVTYQIVHGTSAITVELAALTGVSVAQNGTLTYNTGNQAAAVTTAATAVNGQPVTFAYRTLPDSGDYGAMPQFSEAGTHIVYFEASAANHKPYNGSFKIVIDPKVVTPAITVAACTYTGSALTPAVAVKDGDTVIDPSEYTLAYSQNIFAGKDTATVTVTDNDGGNYTVNGSRNFTIAQAAAPTLRTVTQAIKYNVTAAQTASVADVGMPGDAEILRYTAQTAVVSGASGTGATFSVDENGLVTYTVTGGQEGVVITLPVTISSRNYLDAVVNVVVTLTPKDDQQPLILTGGTTVVYGQTLTFAAEGGSGTGDVRYVVTNGTGEAEIDAVTGVLTPVNVGTVKVKAIRAEDEDYEEVSSSEIEVSITPAAATGKPSYTRISSRSKTLADVGLTADGSTLFPGDGTLEWLDEAGNVLPLSTIVEKNETYTWRFTPSSSNYTPLTGTLVPYPSSGDTVPVRPAIAPAQTDNGSVSVSPKNAKEGDTVTITVKPDEGCTLDTITVVDENGKKLKLTQTGDAQYTFTMPDGSVEIKAVFSDGAAAQELFADVKVNDYFYDAVRWAIKNGITNGVSRTMFGPDLPCTRAQIVTFLWRASGSPEPESMSGFADVSADSYYAKAVAWAVENGITSGTGDGKFSPDAPCTRAQAVTFLHSAFGSPAASGSAEFGDVPAAAYYANAVAWADENSITTGIGGGRFGSDNDCTRAQIVTFLYRAMAE